MRFGYSHDASFQSFYILLDALKRQDALATIIIGDFPEAQLKTLLMTFPGSILLDNPGVTEFDATFSSFNFDNAAGTRAMLRHLLDSGCRRIVLLNGPEDHFFSRIMEQSYRKEHALRHIPIDRNMILHADFTATGAAQVMEEFLQKKIPFDAVFCLTMDAGFVIHHALLAAGRKIPDDVGLLTYGGGYSIGEYFTPAITTISVDLTDGAKEVVKIFEECFWTNSVTAHSFLMHPYLEERDSLKK